MNFIFEKQYRAVAVEALSLMKYVCHNEILIGESVTLSFDDNEKILVSIIDRTTLIKKVYCFSPVCFENYDKMFYSFSVERFDINLCSVVPLCATVYKPDFQYSTEKEVHLCFQCLYNYNQSIKKSIKNKINNPEYAVFV